VMKAIIIDDEKKAREGLAAILEMLDLEVELIGTADSLQSGSRLLKKCSPDVVFLDIELQDGLGVEMLDNFKERKWRTIFTTAYGHYAIRALKLKAYDYILKPIDPIELEDTLYRLNEELFLERFQLEAKPESRLSIPTSEGLRVIQTGHIIRLQSENNYTNIIIEDEKDLLVSRTLKKFEEKLISGFLRVHHSHLVNVKKVVEYVKRDGGSLTLENGDSIPVGKKYKTLVEKVLLQWTTNV